MSQMSFPGMGGGGSGGGGAQLAELDVGITVDTSAADAGIAGVSQNLVNAGNTASGPASAGFQRFGENVAGSATKARQAISSLNMAFGQTSPFGPLLMGLQGVQTGLSALKTPLAEGANGFDKMVAAGAKIAGVGLAVTALGGVLSQFARPLQQANAALDTAISNTTDKVTGAQNAMADYRGEIDKSVKTGQQYGFSQDQVRESLAKLTVQTRDPVEAFRELNYAETLAVATHKSLSDATSDLGRQHAGLFRSLRQLGIQLPNVTNAAKDLAKAQKELSRSTEALSKDEQALSDFQARVAASQAHRSATSTTHVAAAQTAEANAAQASMDAQGKVADATDRLQTLRTTAYDTAQQKIVDSEQHLQDLQAEWADADARRAATLAEQRDAAAQQSSDAVRNLNEMQMRNALSPARNAVEQYNRMLQVQHAQETINTAKDHERDVGEQVITTAAQQLVRSETLHKAAEAVTSAKANELKVQQQIEAAEDAQAKAIENQTKATVKLAAAQAKLATAQDSSSSSGGMTVAEQQQERKLQEKIARDKANMAKANADIAGANDQTEKLQAAFNNAMDKVMEREKGILDRRKNTWTGHLAGLKAGIVNFAENASKFAPVVTGVGMSIMALGGITNVIGHLGKLAGGLASAGTAAAEVVPELMGAAVAEDALGASGWIALGPIALIVAGVAALAFAGYELYTHWKDVTKWLGEAWGNIEGFAKRSFGAVINFFKKWGPDLLLLFLPVVGIPLWIYQHWSTIEDDAKKIWNGVTKAVSGAIDDVVGAVESLPGKVIDVVKGAGEWLLDAGRWILQGLVKGWKLEWHILTDLPKDIYNTVTGGLQDAVHWIEDVGYNVLVGFWNGFIKMGNWIASEIGKFIDSIIPGPIRSVLKLLSPSKVMEEIGSLTMQGMHKGMLSQAGVISQTAKDIANSIAFQPEIPSAWASGGSNRPMNPGAPYAGVGAMGGAGGQVVNLNFTMPVSGVVMAQGDLQDNMKKFLQQGAQSNGGLSKFLSTQP